MSKTKNTSNFPQMEHIVNTLQHIAFVRWRFSFDSDVSVTSVTMSGT